MAKKKVRVKLGKEVAKKRATRRTPVEKVAAPSAILRGDLSGLREMSLEEAKTASTAAQQAGKFHIPFSLINAWTGWTTDSESIPLYVERLRKLIVSPDLDDPAKQAFNLAILVELMVARFERLVRSGNLDSVLPRLTAIPILYSPLAGKGAPAWQRAKTLYDEKKVGTAGGGKYRGRDPKVSRGSMWGEVAECGVRAARIVAAQLQGEIPRWLESAVAYCKCEFRRPPERIPVRAVVYLLKDGGVAYIQDWVPLCKGLAENVTDDLAGYKKVVKAMLDDFFATPSNRERADALLDGMVKGAGNASRASAVNQARKRILACVGRL